jgi:hypothetical protein
MTDVSMHAIRGFRMRRQHLIERAPAGTMLEAVEAVHGIQAQIRAHAVFAVAQRNNGVTAGDIEQALWEDRSLIKTWAMRGTVYWLPGTEEQMFRTALTQLRRGWIDHWWRKQNIPNEDRQHLFEVVLDILRERPMHRKEIAELAVPRIGEWSRPWLTDGWGGAYHTMCQFGLLVFGPHVGTNVTFARRDTWGTLGPIVEDPEAPRELIRRYLRSFGPATVQDATYWIGANLRDVLPQWNSLADELVPIETDGKTRYLLATDLEDLQAMETVTLPVRLIPAFDPLLLAPRDKGELLDMRFHKRIFGAAAWVYPALLVDGRVVANWTYERKQNHIEVVVHPFTRINKKLLPAISRDARHLAAAIGRDAVASIADE